MPHLLDPFRLHDLELANRVVMAPLTRARSGPDRIPNDLMREYYAQRASAGLIVSEATTISPQANGWVESPGIYTDAMEAGWRRITDALHAAGGKIFLQLWHMGRASHSDYHGGQPAVAPSAIAINGDGISTPQGKKPYETPRSLSTDEVKATIEDYRIAARRARAAGFDGVEVHAANGYLIDQFLQARTNHRTDAYVGSLDARCRFLDEVFEAVVEGELGERPGGWELAQHSTAQHRPRLRVRLGLGLRPTAQTRPDPSPIPAQSQAQAQARGDVTMPYLRAAVSDNWKGQYLICASRPG